MKTLSLIQTKKNRYQNERVSRDGHSVVLIMICGGQAQVHGKHCIPPIPPPPPSSFFSLKEISNSVVSPTVVVRPRGSVWWFISCSSDFQDYYQTFKSAVTIGELHRGGMPQWCHMLGKGGGWVATIIWLLAYLELYKMVRLLDKSRDVLQLFFFYTGTIILYKRQNWALSPLLYKIWKLNNSLTFMLGFNSVSIQPDGVTRFVL